MPVRQRWSQVLNSESLSWPLHETAPPHIGDAHSPPTPQALSWPTGNGTSAPPADSAWPFAHRPARLRRRTPVPVACVTGPWHSRHPSTSWVNAATWLAPFSWRSISLMAITRGIVMIVPHQTAGIGQGFYLKPIGMRFKVGREIPRRIFHTQLRMPVGFPSPHR